MQHDTGGALIVAQAKPNNNQGFQLPPATQGQSGQSDEGQTSTQQNIQPPPQSQDGSTAIQPPNPGPYDNLTPTALTIGAAVVVILAIAFFFIGRSVRGHLISRRASPGAAGAAGWALFAFLLSAAATVVLGVVGDLWTVLTYILPMGALCAVTLILFMIMYLSATKSAR